MKDKIDSAQRDLKEVQAKISETFAEAETDLKSTGMKIPKQFYDDFKYVQIKTKDFSDQLYSYKKKSSEKSLNGFERRRVKRLLSNARYLCIMQAQWLINNLDDFVEASETSSGLKLIQKITNDFTRELNKFPKVNN